MFYLNNIIISLYSFSYNTIRISIETNMQKRENWLIDNINKKKKVHNCETSTLHTFE